jgi:hypothetical protein
MRGVLNPTVFAIRGTNQSVAMPTMLLDFEMQGSLGLHNGHNIHHNIPIVNGNIKLFQNNVWLHLKAKNNATFC